MTTEKEIEPTKPTGKPGNSIVAWIVRFFKGLLAGIGASTPGLSGGVMLVEWGDVVGDALGTGLIVQLAAPENADTEDSVTVRQIEIDWRGMQWETRWDKLRASLSNWSAS